MNEMGLRGLGVLAVLWLVVVAMIASRIGGKQDSQWIFLGIGVEAALYLLAPSSSRKAIDHLDALVGQVCTLDSLLEDRL